MGDFLRTPGAASTGSDLDAARQVDSDESAPIW